MSDLNDNYDYFYKKSKRHYKEGKFQKSLDALRSAYEIRPSEQLQSKINKLEDMVSEAVAEEILYKPDENKILVEDRFYVNKINYEKLYNYQRDGVLWLFKLFESKKGGILADDMGLGKTVQVVFFLRELFESDIIKNALIAMPKSLLINWEREFKNWAPDLTVLMYTSNERERNLNKVRRRGGILLTTYGTIMNSWEDLNCDSTFKWSVLALDEGHRIKNPSSKTFKAVNAIRADMRLVMTGTAVQNKLKELWALFDFTHQGSLLGTYPTFSIEYERPITSSRNKDASEAEKIYGDEISNSLKKLISKFFLRRTKEEVTKSSSSSVPKLMKKNDLILWIKMTNEQVDIYKRFLQSDDIKHLLTMSEKRSPLMELNILKKICDHPRLLPADHCLEMGLTFAESIKDVEISMLQQESGKMEVLLLLLQKLTSEGHKSLVFSQSKVVLNIVSRILRSNGIEQSRLDGDVLKPIDRQNIVDNFNNNPNCKVLLLTSQVGGVGLTLTGADRAIIYDMSWNPAIDAQAVDRVYRIGQKKDVIVYRLITCGTVEEKIYRRQIFKDSLNRQTTGVKTTDQNPYRYFTQGELRELFQLDDPQRSQTQVQLAKMHSGAFKSSPSLDEHLEWLASVRAMSGVSHHDLMFSHEDVAVKVDEDTRERLQDNRRAAELRLAMEASAKGTDEEAQLRLMMSKMTIQEHKQRAKEKAASGAMAMATRLGTSAMFAPSKADVKRPQYNVPKSISPVTSFQEPIVIEDDDDDRSNDDDFEKYQSNEDNSEHDRSEHDQSNEDDLEHDQSNEDDLEHDQSNEDDLEHDQSNDGDLDHDKESNLDGAVDQSDVDYTDQSETSDKAHDALADETSVLELNDDSDNDSDHLIGAAAPRRRLIIDSDDDEDEEGACARRSKVPSEDEAGDGANSFRYGSSQEPLDQVIVRSIGGGADESFSDGDILEASF